MKAILLILVFTLSFSAQASYIDKASKVIGSLNSNFINFDGYKNHYYNLNNGHKEALIIVTGVAEPAIKYWQLVREFSGSYDVYLWDHIGQGKSDRLHKKMGLKKVYIDKFLTYEDSFNNFLKRVIAKYSKTNVISHSMGSHVMLRQLLKNDSSIDKLVLVTPMVNINKYFIPDFISKFVLKTFYKPTDWAPTQGDTNPDYTYFTSSKENFENYMNLLNKKFPDQKTTGVTAGWLKESLKSVAYVLKADFSKVNTKVLVFTGGKDKIVKSSASRSFCEKLINCNNIHYKNGKHQLLLETDDIRLDLIKQVKLFFKNSNN